MRGEQVFYALQGFRRIPAVIVWEGHDLPRDAVQSDIAGKREAKIRSQMQEGEASSKWSNDIGEKTRRILVHNDDFKILVGLRPEGCKQPG